MLVGPYMFNFQEIFELLSQRGVCIMTPDEKSFETTLLDLLGNPEKMKKWEKRHWKWFMKIREPQKGILLPLRNW